MENTTCPLCGKNSAILVEGILEHWHCGICHREWPRREGVLPEDMRWMDDDGEIRH